MSRIAPTGLVLVAIVVAATVAWPRSSDPVFHRTSVASLLTSDALAELVGEATAEPIVLDDLADGAVSALSGYSLAAGTVEGSRWQIDLVGSERAADRAALGLLALGTDFERTGFDFGVLEGEGPLPRPRIETQEQARWMVAALLELRGSVTGRVDASGWDQEHLERFGQIAELAGTSVETIEGTQELWFPRRVDRAEIATWPTTCGDRTPVVGGGGCGQSPANLEVDRFVDLGGWRSAMTGSLVPGSEQSPAAIDGGVSWSNREAQAYRPEGVVVTDAGLELTARPVETPSVDAVPFVSGMVFSDDTYGFGRFDFEVTVPFGEGLWPAVWLLDADACESPGRCPGYGTERYHELDVLETQGDGRLFTSAHWFDERFSSFSVETTDPGLIQGARHTITLERRPGLVVWRLDGREVASLAGSASAESGPHRAGPMMVILNLAVGGSFSGDRVLGRTAPWWGDAMVPDTFPQLGWPSATLVVHQMRYSGL